MGDQSNARGFVVTRWAVQQVFDADGDRAGKLLRRGPIKQNRTDGVIEPGPCQTVIPRLLPWPPSKTGRGDRDTPCGRFLAASSKDSSLPCQRAFFVDVVAIGVVHCFAHRCQNTERLYSCRASSMLMPQARAGPNPWVSRIWTTFHTRWNHPRVQTEVTGVSIRRNACLPSYNLEITPLLP